MVGVFQTTICQYINAPPMHFLQPEGKLKFYSRRYTGLDEDVLTEHMVGVGGVEGDVDGRDVVVGVTHHLSVSSS